MNDNPFTRRAEAMTAPAQRQMKVKLAKSERDAPMKPSAQEQQLIDREKLLRGYRAARKAEYKKYLEGPNGDGWRSLRDWLDVLTIENAHELPYYISEQRWLLDSDISVRRDALAIIAAAIIVLRLEEGMAPIDDALPGEEPTIFETIREQLGVITP